MSACGSSSAGTYNVTVPVSDGSLTTSANFSWTVTDKAVDDIVSRRGGQELSASTRQVVVGGDDLDAL